MSNKKKDKQSLKYLMNLFGTQAVSRKYYEEFENKYGSEELHELFNEHKREN